MSIQNVKIIDNLTDLEIAFELLKMPWINHPYEYIEPYIQAFEHFKKTGFPEEVDVSFKKITAKNDSDFLNKYVLIQASLRLAVTKKIITLSQYEERINLYEKSFMDFDDIENDNIFSVTFDFVE